MAHAPTLLAPAHYEGHTVTRRRERRDWFGFRRGISLRTALVLRVLIPLGVVLVLVATVSLRTIERFMEERMKDDVALVARALRLPVARALERGRVGTIQEALQSAFRIRRVYSAHVYGPEGDLLASLGAPYPDERPARLSDLATGGDLVGEFGSIGGREVYSTFVPLTDPWGQNLGLLQLTRRGEDFDSQRAQLRWQAALILLAGLVVTTGLVLLGHYRAVGHPLERLGGSMARVAEGEGIHRASTAGPHEIRALASAFNQMLDALLRADSEIDERRRAQDRLRQQLIRNEKLAAVGELSAGVAHELGSPLSVIDGRAQRLLRDGSLAPEMRGDIEDVRVQVRRMEAIVRQLLEFGRHDPSPTVLVALDEVVKGSVAAASDDASRANVEIVLDPPSESLLADLAPRRFESAVANLIRNACQAVGGQDTGRIEVRWWTEHDEILLTVEDDGPGISDEIRSRVFEPFFTTKPTGAGTGLGLAVVHGVVEGHGGRIIVDTSPLGGARFTVHLPRAIEAGKGGGT
jgi:signal transduction histidine kinase